MVDPNRGKVRVRARTLAREQRYAASLRELFLGREQRALTFRRQQFVLVFDPRRERVPKATADAWRQHGWIEFTLCACERAALKLTDEGLRVVGAKRDAASAA